MHFIHLVNIVTYEYWDVVVDSAVVTLQMTTVALFCAVFAHAKFGALLSPRPSLLRWHLIQSLSENFSLPVVIALALFIGVLGFSLLLSLEKTITFSRLLSNLQSLFLLFVGVWILSPILKTLTEPLRSDIFS